jgi:hypothetical protein
VLLITQPTTADKFVPDGRDEKYSTLLEVIGFLLDEPLTTQRKWRIKSLPVLKYLYEQRKITTSGHETTDTDPGIATTKDDYSLETYILSTNLYESELPTNLDQVPEAGVIVVVSLPKPKGGSGFLTRVFAIFTVGKDGAGTRVRSIAGRLRPGRVLAIQAVDGKSRVLRGQKCAWSS